MADWNTEELPDQAGKVAVVTGANSGVGLYTAIGLAAAGAHVIMGCRDLNRSAPALERVQEAGRGSAELRPLDLADLDSVAEFAASVTADYGQLDLLVNNAGVMGGPRRSTKQGLELQMGTNHLGHFALAAELWPLLASASAARVVSLSSLAARQGLLSEAMSEELLTDPHPYRAMAVYSNTKQATLLFSQELQRRITAAGMPVASVAAHPGVSSTNLFNRQLRENKLGFLVPAAAGLGRIALHSPKASANPSLRAATDVTVPGGAFVGPVSMGQFRGRPDVIPLYTAGKDPATAARLWYLSERITGRPFPLPAP